MYNSSKRKHVHEFLISTKVVEGHNHRIAGITRQAIPLASGGHRHRFISNTDFYEDHHHQAIGLTGRNIKLRNGRHTHYIKSVTTFKDGHRHRFQAATLIEDPIS